MPVAPLRRAAAAAAVLLIGAACTDEFVADPEAGLRASIEMTGLPVSAAALIGDSITLRVSVAELTTGRSVVPADIDWTLEPAGAAEIRSEAGDSIVLRLLAIGPLGITATLDDPSFDTASVSETITVKLAGITLSAASADTLRSLGDGVVVQARGLDAGGASIRVDGWSWRAGEAATIEGSGDSIRAVAAANGRAWIVATHPYCPAPCADSIAVNVNQLVSQVTLTPSSAMMTWINDTIHMTATPRDANGNTAPGTIAWSSSASGVASVAPSGVVMATGTGTATIIAQTGAFADTAEVIVDQVVATVTLPLSETNMSVGDTLRLAATARDSGGTTVTGLPTMWTTTDSTVVSVTEGGMMTARARGTATVRATIAGLVAPLDITVAAWALAFDGDDHVSVAGSSTLTLDSTFTLEAWVRPRSGAASAALLAIWDGAKTGSSYGLYLQGLVPTVLLRSATANTAISLGAPSGVPQNQWHHIAFVYDRGTGTLYVDGDSVAAATGLTVPNPVVAPLRLGADAQATPAHLTGDLDEVRIWGTARSAAQIAASMGVRLAPAENPGLRAYWPLLEGEGNPVDVVSGLVGVLGGGLGAAATPVWTTDASPAP